MMSSDDPSGSRMLTPAMRLLERELRRKGKLAEGDHIVDWCSGAFSALYEDRARSSARPRTLLPWTKPSVIAVYTERWILFVGRRFARACVLQAVLRAELYEGSVRVLYSPAADRGFSLIEFEPVAGPLGDDPQRFVNDLTFRRDIATAGIDDLEGHMERIRQIRDIPSVDLIRRMVLGSNK